MAIASTLYNTFFKRTSTFALVCVGSAFFFERTLDFASDQIFDTINKGKLWKQIKDNYSQ